ncbi:hypothetical protein DL96DRAFT_1584816 [Flagelloscypha sp. PMI_526]|nr:hypothetical protein DL96DRAFT_1584816 [Flagelloscypha sp. PMI_526]
MPVFAICQQKTVTTYGSKPFKMESWTVPSSVLAPIETALRTSSTVPYHSTQTLEEATSFLLQAKCNTEKLIESTRQFLQLLEAHNSELLTVSEPIRLAASQCLRPFPPLPMDLAQYIIELVCMTDKGTTLSVALASKQMREWSDEYLWTNIAFQYKHHTQPGVLVELLSRQEFLDSPQAKRIQAVGLQGSLPAHAERILALPNLKTLVVQQPRALSDLHGVTCPSLRHILCTPPERSNSSFEFNIPLFQTVTHLNLIPSSNWRGNSDWCNADWSSLKSLPCLTHLYLNISSMGGEVEFMDKFKLALPTALQVAVIRLSEERQPQAFEAVRTGRIDIRLVAGKGAGQTDPQVKPWVLHLAWDNPMDWISVDFQGPNNLWSRAEAILKERNAILQLKDEEQSPGSRMKQLFGSRKWLF